MRQAITESYSAISVLESKFYHKISFLLRTVIGQLPCLYQAMQSRL